MTARIPRLESPADTVPRLPSWPLRQLWGFFFRVFPAPVPTGLYRIGKPNRNSPVLVSCNFALTVGRLARRLRRAETAAWLVIADSKGVNVWCAAGGAVLDTGAVVRALKTSGVGDYVNHREATLPPLAGPGVAAHQVSKQSDWRVRWGPTRLSDLPAFLHAEGRTTPAMQRVTYTLGERLDTALGSLFVFYLLGALGVAVFATALLPSFLLVGAGVFLLFYLICPWLPGRAGWVKALPLAILLGAALGLSWTAPAPPLASVAAALQTWRAELVLALVFLFLWAGELGGVASTLPSELDPLLASLGIGGIGNTAFAGTVRTDLLRGRRQLSHDLERCTGCGNCRRICPQGVWEQVATDGPLSGKPSTLLANAELCTACCACLTNCPSAAITAPPPRSSR